MSPLTYRTGEYQAASRFTTHATSDPLTAHYVRYAMHVAHDSPVEKTQILRRMQHLKFCSFSLTVAHDVKKSAKKKYLLCLGGNKHMIVFNLSTLRSHIPTIFFFCKGKCWYRGKPKIVRMYLLYSGVCFSACPLGSKKSLRFREPCAKT